MNSHPVVASAPHPRTTGRHRVARLALLPACLLGLVPPAQPGVVINEIMYHPPDDREDLQWVEVYNPGPEPVDLAGWSFRKGVNFTFPDQAGRLLPGGFAVVSRDRGGFRLHYGTNALVFGDFTGRLSHGGERIELADRAGRIVDALTYDDAAPWPASPDGMAPSLERIVPTAPGDDPANWAPSPMPRFASAGGTPGLPNAAARTNLPPVVTDVSFTSPAPGQPLALTATLSDPDGVDTASVLYRVLTVADTGRASGTRATGTDGEQEIPLQRRTGDVRQGSYAASLPAQPEGSLLRFRIRAVDRTGAERIQPHPAEGRPAWSCFVGANTNDAQIPFVGLLQFGPRESEGRSLRNMHMGPRRGPGAATSRVGEPARGESTLVYAPPGGGALQTFDFIRITPRQGGWKARLQKDRLLEGMSTVNILFEYQPRFVLAEHLAYEVYRAAQVPAPLSGHWRLWLNGQPLGYHLFVEQPNASFLRRNGRDDEGDLYKLIWYGGDLVGQHEKKNNPQTGHAALVALVEALQGSSGVAQWQVIERHFNVPELASYYAVNMCLQNWDGFFNNYFLYHAPGEDGRWEIYPWDEDKTWGDYDGASAAYDWYSMPLTMGMAGDRPRMSLLERFFGGGGPHGGPSWWRSPGWISGPVLANPTFRGLFRTRLRELCDTAFTTERLEPVIAQLERQLEPEVRYRAEIVGISRNREIRIDYGGPTDDSKIPQGRIEAALDQFHRHIDSFRRQVRHRRAFIVDALENEP